MLIRKICAFAIGTAITCSAGAVASYLTSTNDFEKEKQIDSNNNLPAKEHEGYVLGEGGSDGGWL